MDRKIEKKFWTLKRLATYGGITVLVVFVGYEFIFADRRSTLKVEKDKMTISEIKRGEFKEFIPQTGTATPSRTVYMDAIEGGNIKRIVRESGAMVKAGDIILELTNLNRELAVLQQESSLIESINRSREARLSIKKNDVDQRQTLALIDQQLATMGPKYRRQKQLYEKKLIAKQDLEQAEADYKYNIERRKITYEFYKSDSLNNILQLADLEASQRKMSLNLEGMGKILDNLIIRAPIDGQLSLITHWEIGQSVAQGQRLGQVDIVGSYKVRVPIDELYLPKIRTGLPATTSFDGKDYKLIISYVYPNVVAGTGRFEVDMDFDGETPKGIRVGMSLRLRIELGQASEELLLPSGGFYKDTGGNWIFILDSDNHAVRRDIKLGRKNTENFEVLEGLKPGDRVITSSYENFGNNEVLVLY